MTSLYSFAAAIILSSIMLTQDVVDASIYQNIGIGICKPESGESYHYILKRDYEGQHWSILFMMDICLTCSHFLF